MKEIGLNNFKIKFNSPMSKWPQFIHSLFGKTEKVSAIIWFWRNFLEGQNLKSDVVKMNVMVQPQGRTGLDQPDRITNYGENEH